MLTASTDPSFVGNIVSFFNASDGSLLGRSGLGPDGQAYKHVGLAQPGTEIYATVTIPNGRTFSINSIDLTLALPTIAFVPTATVGLDGAVTFTVDVSDP